VITRLSSRSRALVEGLTAFGQEARGVSSVVFAASGDLAWTTGGYVICLLPRHSETHSVLQPYQQPSSFLWLRDLPCYWMGREQQRECDRTIAVSTAPRSGAAPYPNRRAMSQLFRQELCYHANRFPPSHRHGIRWPTISTRFTDENAYRRLLLFMRPPESHALLDESPHVTLIGRKCPQRRKNPREPLKLFNTFVSISSY